MHIFEIQNSCMLRRYQASNSAKAIDRVPRQ